MGARIDGGVTARELAQQAQRKAVAYRQDKLDRRANLSGGSVGALTLGVGGIVASRVKGPVWARAAGAAAIAAVTGGATYAATKQQVDERDYRSLFFPEEGGMVLDYWDTKRNKTQHVSYGRLHDNEVYATKDEALRAAAKIPGDQAISDHLVATASPKAGTGSARDESVDDPFFVAESPGYRLLDVDQNGVAAAIAAKRWPAMSAKNVTVYNDDTIEHKGRAYEQRDHTGLRPAR